MSYKNVEAYFESTGYADRITVLDTSSATVTLAANAIGCTNKQIIKTLTFLVAEKPVMVACAGDVKIDNAKFKAQFGEKAKMIPAPLVEEYVGHAVGGVCPFATKEDVKIYLDETVKQPTDIYPAAGDVNCVCRLNADELLKLSGAIGFIDVCKPIA